MPFRICLAFPPPKPEMLYDALGSRWIIEHGVDSGEGVEVEGEQLLLQGKDVEEVVEWIEMRCVCLGVRDMLD